MNKNKLNLLYSILLFSSAVLIMYMEIIIFGIILMLFSFNRLIDINDYDRIDVI